ncbi:glycoside hydrolase superfamily [Xylariaceae sp. FL0662B]|nr:glycoside hydrolase superfamily [Xylariaceae sp. FL0662B]
MRATTISLTFLSLLHLSAGQLRHRHVHRHRANRAFIPKRDRITVTDSTYSVPTEMPEVVVYVDQYGNPVRTATEVVVYVPQSVEAPATPEASSLPTSTPEPPSPAPLPATSAPPVEQPEALPAPSQPAEPIPEPSSSLESQTPAQSQAPAQAPHAESVAPPPEPSASSEPPPPVSDGGSLHGVTYSPYKGSGGCKSAEEVDADFALVAKDYGVIRLYGVDCDQVATAYAAAKKHGNKLFLGIFDISAVDEAVKTMAAGVQNDWDVVDTVSVGNELVNNGEVTVDQSLGALSQARSALRAAGYQGPVVIVDTFVAMINHPELCDQSDYCAANVHPFFDPNTGADQAGKFVTSTVGNIRSKLSDPSKRIVVTETGWPWKGEPNGQAIPGMDSQASALASIKGAYTENPGNVILFTAFNDLWKKAEAGTFMAEQFWGMKGTYSPCDQ